MSLATTESRTRLWLLLADRYRKLAKQEPHKREYWLAEAAKAEQIAAA